MVPESKARAGGREDAELIEAIARSRDQAAFAELLRRYESDAYGLALRIVGNCQSAEDIVQEVMVRVWTSASSYRGDGPVRAWLLRIVARESINTIKKIKRISAKMKTEPAEDLSSDDVAPQKEMESSELADALRREFNRLPELERQLVGLHYAGGLSQQEISDALSIPQQTISNHLNKTLKTLRVALSAAGYTAVPLIATEGMIDALCSGVKPPSGLQNRVLAKIAARKPVSQRRSTRTRAARNSSAAIAAGAVGVVVLAGVLWVVFAKQPTAVPVVPPTENTTIPAPAVFDWNHRWTFENGKPEDLLETEPVKWKWNQATKTMDAAAGVPVEFFVRYRLPDKPLLFTMKTHGLDLSRKYFFGEALVIQHEIVNKQLNSLNSANLDHPVSTPDLNRKLYVYGNKAVALINDHITVATELEEKAAANILVFKVENVAIEEISVKTLSESEVPDFVKDPKTYANQ